jgi:hypothetical protein
LEGKCFIINASDLNVATYPVYEVLGTAAASVSIVSPGFWSGAATLWTGAAKDCDVAEQGPGILFFVLWQELELRARRFPRCLLLSSL